MPFPTKEILQGAGWGGVREVKFLCLVRAAQCTKPHANAVLVTAFPYFTDLFYSTAFFLTS